MTEPNTEPNPEQKFWEVFFTFVTRKECSAIVKANTEAEAEAIVERLSSGCLEYGVDLSDESKFHKVPDCESEDETIEEVTALGPFTEEDL